MYAFNTTMYSIHIHISTTDIFNRYITSFTRDFKILVTNRKYKDITPLYCPESRCENYERIRLFITLKTDKFFAKRTMASMCGRMALRAAARQNVTFQSVRTCKSKCQ